MGRLADALNTMLARIEAAYRAREEGEARALDSEDRMRQFVADASRELRTPLTSVRGLAEFSLQQGTDASHGELLRLMNLIQTEATRMGRLVDDLLMLAQFDQDHALQHTPRGSAVTVTVEDQAGQAQLTVADHGPGMTADQASRVFERFYRTDRTRTRARGGSGLGLPIAAALAAARAGTITVDTQPGRGAAFQVRLPLSTVASEKAGRR